MTAPLDWLYGQGTDAALREALAVASLPKPKLEQIALRGAGSVRVNVTWGKAAAMKIECFADRVHFLHLRAEGAGVYGALCETLPGLFAERGVVRFTASAADAEAAKALKRRGGWKGRRSLTWKVG